MRLLDTPNVLFKAFLDTQIRLRIPLRIEEHIKIILPFDLLEQNFVGVEQILRRDLRDAMRFARSTTMIVFRLSTTRQRMRRTNYHRRHLVRIPKLKVGARTVEIEREAVNRQHRSFGRRRQMHRRRVIADAYIA